jgi:hypothetical protein
MVSEEQVRESLGSVLVPVAKRSIVMSRVARLRSTWPQQP